MAREESNARVVLVVEIEVVDGVEVDGVLDVDGAADSLVI